MQPNDDNIKQVDTTDAERGPECSGVIRQLFSTLSPQELQEAEDNLVEYLKAVLRIADRLRQERTFDDHRKTNYDDDERSTLTN